MDFRVIYIMGVTGSGKTTIGRQLSAATGYAFVDADDLHPQKNIEKMRSGQPLTDEDRWPWLDTINEFVSGKIRTDNIILACSALKEIYRSRLSKGIEQQCIWVFLQGSYDTIAGRLQNRSGHFMPATLLQSQFDILEIPQTAITVDVTNPIATIVDHIISEI